MIESNISNVAAAAMRQDVRSVQGQREANKTTVADQASSIPMASSGVEAADSTTTAVASQPAGIVTRLGETTEQVPLYEANRPTAGSIIRPAIEVAQDVRQTPTDNQLNEQVALERKEVNEVEERPTMTTRGNDPSVNDVEKLV
ncbi:MAG TPA: hypothetical protein VJY63_00805 [Marinospirillum sp.]|uniref:hypothetical protein n=1 Tax=Marinospirillum sp. TaxID=2183934 RepID=UPI002B48DC21|nr:hypothetical protein [Marinospirillum sp.]HKM14451.1 hypothetical protein [Marinospirillum sp.]